MMDAAAPRLYIAIGFLQTVPMTFVVFQRADHFGMGKSGHCHSKILDFFHCIVLSAQASLFLFIIISSAYGQITTG